MNTVEIIGIIKDIILAGAAVTAGVIAVIGLQSWKREHAGKLKYDLARRLMTASLKVREGISTVRNPGMFGSEYEGRLAERDDNKTPEEIESDKVAYAYEQRWQNVADALNGLDLELLEAEVLLGDEVAAAFRPLKSCTTELLINLRRHLRSYTNRRYQEKLTPEKMNEIDDVIYWVSDDPKEDKFMGKVISAIDEIKTALKPHLPN